MRIKAVLMTLEMRDAIGASTEKWRRLAHEIRFGVVHGFAALGTIGYEGRFDSYRFNTTRDFDRQKRSDQPQLPQTSGVCLAVS